MAAERAEYSRSALISEDHVTLVLACIVRMGVLRHTSIYEAWVKADSGSLRDARIAGAITRDNFTRIWQAIVFSDYKQFKYNAEGQIVTSDHIVRTRGILELCERNWPGAS